MRTLTRAGALSAVASAALFLAPAAHATPPGDNGTVKIHDAATDEELRHNEPRVCSFYLDAFGFDGGQQVGWHIESWAPTAGVKGETVKSGELTLDNEGHGRSDDMTLPDGHYKLFWNFEGEKGSAKHKVFWTDCEETEETKEPGKPGQSGIPSPDTSAATPTPPSGAESSAAPSPQGGGSGPEGDLAETGNGAPVGLLTGIAATLLAAGGYLLHRRRSA
jgi:LPXTG-motif cell wall-anchored protein